MASKGTELHMQAGEQVWVDPQMKPILQAMLDRMASRAPMTEIAPEEMRRRAAADFTLLNEDPPALARVEDRTIPGPFGATRLRLYDPLASTTPRPALIYFHGGGWVIGDLETEDRSLRQLALASGAAIVSVDYKLAPEHKFPKPVEDCAAAFTWIADHAAELGLDPARLAVGGASAGANLALASTLLRRDRGDRCPCFMLLFYGVFGDGMETESYRLFGGGDYGLGHDAMAFFYSLYLNDPAQRTAPLVSPVLADLHGLPPVFLSVAGLDPLRDDSRLLASRLRTAKVPADIKEYPGVVHGFTLMGRMLDAANKALDDAGRALAAGLK